MKKIRLSKKQIEEIKLGGLRLQLESEKRNFNYCVKALAEYDFVGCVTSAIHFKEFQHSELLRYLEHGNATDLFGFKSETEEETLKSSIEYYKRLNLIAEGHLNHLTQKKKIEAVEDMIKLQDSYFQLSMKNNEKLREKLRKKGLLIDTKRKKKNTPKYTGKLFTDTTKYGNKKK